LPSSPPAAKVQLRGEVLSCKLEAQGNGKVCVRDELWEKGQTAGLGFTTTLLGVHTSATPWRAAVACKKTWPDTEAWWYEIRITATQVA
jgi:hypothetical protein